ncbi:MAG: hypothetical protein V7K21_12680 [Nostoc sp.]
MLSHAYGGKLCSSSKRLRSAFCREEKSRAIALTQFLEENGRAITHLLYDL